MQSNKAVILIDAIYGMKSNKRMLSRQVKAIYMEVFQTSWSKGKKSEEAIIISWIKQLESKWSCMQQSDTPQSVNCKLDINQQLIASND